MTHFTCSHCGAPAQMIEGKISRSCSHYDSGVAANLTATAYGSASFAENPPNKVEIALSRVLDFLNLRRV